MSMRVASFTPSSVTHDIVVAGPQASDVLARTLQTAYAAEMSAYETFGDVLRQLDRIDATPPSGSAPPRG